MTDKRIGDAFHIVRADMPPVVVNGLLDKLPAQSSSKVDSRPITASPVIIFVNRVAVTKIHSILYTAKFQF